MKGFGCHSSTWVLDYDKELDFVDHIIDTVSETKFKSIDVQVALLGKYTDNPKALEEKLLSKGVELAALTLPFDWFGKEETKEEKQRGDFYIEFVKHFPGAILNTPSRVGKDRENLYETQKNILNNANKFAERAYEEGVQVSFHPASPPTSFFRTQEDYDVMFNYLDSNYISYTPDAGHIAMGGMDPVKIVQDNIPLIKHVHFKDHSKINGWSELGTGDINFKRIIEILNENNYQGWIMIEEETEEAAKQPDVVVKKIDKYVHSELYK